MNALSLQGWMFYRKRNLLRIFNHPRGLGKGILFSIYLCIVYREIDPRIYHAVKTGQWNLSTFGAVGSPSLTNVLWMTSFCLLRPRVTKRIFLCHFLMIFYCSSREKVNKIKTQVYFSKNLSTAIANNVSTMLGFSSNRDLGKYLWMPLFHSKVSKSTY